MNPNRISSRAAFDATFQLCLEDAQAISLATGEIVTKHDLRIEFPRFFPAVPLELYLDLPVLHPNIHPQTGFVCLWDAHRSSNRVAHGLHKTVAMLGWRLLNLDARHLMQPGAVTPFNGVEQAKIRLSYQPLQGMAYTDFAPELHFTSRRRRLS